MFADHTRPLRRSLFHGVGHPDPGAFLDRLMQGRSVGLGPLRLRVVENAILVPGGGILGPDGSTPPDGQLRGGPKRSMILGEEQIIPVTPAIRIEGEVCYLGWLIDHFGHFLIESTARWWATSHLPDAIPLFRASRTPRPSRADGGRTVACRRKPAHRIAEREA